MVGFIVMWYLNKTRLLFFVVLLQILRATVNGKWGINIHEKLMNYIKICEQFCFSSQANAVFFCVLSQFSGSFDCSCFKRHIPREIGRLETQLQRKVTAKPFRSLVINSYRFKICMTNGKKYSVTSLVWCW